MLDVTSFVAEKYVCLIVSFSKLFVIICNNGYTSEIEFKVYFYPITVNIHQVSSAQCIYEIARKPGFFCLRISEKYFDKYVYSSTEDLKLIIV
jgi:hypothetical protein